MANSPQDIDAILASMRSHLLNIATQIGENAEKIRKGLEAIMIHLNDRLNREYQHNATLKKADALTAIVGAPPLSKDPTPAEALDTINTSYNKRNQDIASTRQRLTALQGEAPAHNEQTKRSMDALNKKARELNEQNANLLKLYQLLLKQPFVSGQDPENIPISKLNAMIQDLDKKAGELVAQNKQLKDDMKKAPMQKTQPGLSSSTPKPGGR